MLCKRWKPFSEDKTKTDSGERSRVINSLIYFFKIQFKNNQIPHKQNTYLSVYTFVIKTLRKQFR